MELLCQSKLRTRNMLAKALLLRTTTLILLRQSVEISLVLPLLQWLLFLFLFQLLHHRTILELATSRARSLSRKLLLRRTMSTNNTSNLSLAHRLSRLRTDKNMNSIFNLFPDRRLKLLRTDRSTSNTFSLSLVHNPKLLLHGPNMNSTLRLFLVRPSHQRNRLRPPRRCQAQPLQQVNTTLHHLGSHRMFNQGRECLLHLNMPLSMTLLLHCRIK
jgi:hypothetical protein